MERTEEMNMDLGVIRDALTQELTISHYSVLKDTRIRDDFIQAVKVTGDLDRVGSTVIPLIIQANALCRAEGFLALNRMRGRGNSVFFDNMVGLLEDRMQLSQITAMYKPAFYYFGRSELVENVLIHDGLMMCLLGCQSKGIEFALNNMLGRHKALEGGFDDDY